MIDKKLFFRKEYKHKSWNTVASNYYPVTSALSLRDEGINKERERQVTIITESSFGGSAGLRGRRNIEIMQNRRHVSYDHYGLREPLNDLDEWGKGI